MSDAVHDDACPSGLCDNPTECGDCDGSGDDGYRECWSCGGSGWRVRSHCRACGGSPYCTCCRRCGAECVSLCSCPIGDAA